ncbi:MAG: ACP S-malonyltransferase [Gammaproteobacteria bacterium]|nr:ACP S-malonyltransferase [Gammaproteobacteria bacterium]MCP4089422.1 ACP S-malonyltransferase [Gammaproteobacteria bacterium]MCP4277537.1 ACP S-malonyltransferase [Gammaproteobacteria bacterium]MCP4831145.1 ACP S-malonyltransferase [Gammaproteobacteria bacterium]MCP4928568.1 ACP S-malonyltransferase [Gammaproteobacteria bacterium]
MSDKIMFVFPGQGSQYAGMGSDLTTEYPTAQKVYAEANDVLGYDIQSLSANGPEAELGLTRNTQPALLAHQIACFEVYKELTGGSVQASLAAGHSLGEYTALVAAGVISFADGLKLVKKRGELMGEHGEGGMLALGLTVEEAAPVADRFYCQIASCNLPQQTVVGGTDADLDALEAALPEIFPRKRATRLKTEGAFHTYLMVTAAREFRTVLDSVEFVPSDVQVLSNYTGLMHEAEPDSIRTRLFFQLFNPVNWVGCMKTAAGYGVSKFIEFGGGIGKGESPAEKKPNLQSIINKNLRALEYDADYEAAINVESLKSVGN